MRLRRVLVAAAFGIGSTAGMAAALTPAHAMGSVSKPTVTFGCGTVTITEGNISQTLQILPCPGPVL
jgi:hypothetical protein